LTRGPEGFDVRKKTNTIDMNMQELEGLQPSNIQTSFYNDKSLLTSANNYVAMLLQIADNAFVEGRSSVFEKDQGEDALYHLHIFREYAKGWIDCRLDQGPFVLVHGDLEPFNLIVNENMDITSVLDWEWSRVVPLQFFKPPLWLKIPDTTKLAWNFVYNDYLKSFDQFLDILRTREREKYGNELLSDEWAKAKENSGFLVANALENWTDMDWFANRYINWKCYQGKADLDKRVKAFMKNPVHKTLIARKLREGIAYRVEVDRLEDTTIEVAPSYSDKPASAIMKHFLYQLWEDTISFSPTVLALGGAIIITGTSYLLVKRIIIRLPFTLY
jgi:Phosphotransferase enzyme family